LTKSLSESS